MGNRRFFDVALLLIGSACWGCNDAGQVLGAAPVKPARRVIAAGAEHACAVRDGLLLCWGKNAAGQVGGGAVSESTPRVVGQESSWQSVVAGESSSCGLRLDGQVWCWGDNNSGQLGSSDRVGGPTPRQVLLPLPATSLSLKFVHACAVLADRSLWCWGENAEGQLGLGGVYPGQAETTPKLVPASGSGWRSVATGQGHTCAIALDGALFCWGRNTEFQLGTTPEFGQVRQPVQVGVAHDWREVDSAQAHNCGIRGGGELWCWGGDLNGALGSGVENEIVQAPRRLGTDTDYQHVVLNTFNTCALRSNVQGNLWCWGRTIEGQLGFSEVNHRLTPAPLNDALDWQSVALGRFFTCGWKEDQGLFCTGENDMGQLGVGDTSRRQVPTAVALTP